MSLSLSKPVLENWPKWARHLRNVNNFFLSILYYFFWFWFFQNLFHCVSSCIALRRWLFFHFRFLTTKIFSDSVSTLSVLSVSFRSLASILYDPVHYLVLYSPYTSCPIPIFLEIFVLGSFNMIISCAYWSFVSIRYYQSFFIGPNIDLSCYSSSLNVLVIRRWCSHAYSAIGLTKILYTLIFALLNRNFILNSGTDEK